MVAVAGKMDKLAVEEAVDMFGTQVVVQVTAVLPTRLNQPLETDNITQAELTGLLLVAEVDRLQESSIVEVLRKTLLVGMEEAAELLDGSLAA